MEAKLDKMSFRAKLPLWVFISVAAIGVAMIFLLLQYRDAIFDEIKLQSLENAYWTNKIPQKNELSGWKTYRNNEYGFEMKYPIFNSKDRIQIEQVNWGTIIKFENWDETSKIFFENFDFVIMDNPRKLSLQEWFAENIDDDNSTLINKGIYQLITLPSGIKTLQMQDVPIPSEFLDKYGPLYTRVYMEMRSNEFIMGFAINGQVNNLDSYGFGGSDGYDALTDRILSTFKFIEPGDTSDWKTYRNEEYGFEFRYPTNFEIKTDTVKITYPDGKKWYRLELTDSSAFEKPFLSFEVNPDGYGPFFPDKTYAIRESDDGSIEITVIHLEEKSENSDDGYVDILPNSIKSKNDNNYFIHFIFKEGGKDWEPIFKEILSTFKFLE